MSSSNKQNRRNRVWRWWWGQRIQNINKVKRMKERTNTQHILPEHISNSIPKGMSFLCLLEREREYYEKCITCSLLLQLNMLFVIFITKFLPNFHSLSIFKSSKMPSIEFHEFKSSNSNQVNKLPKEMMEIHILRNEYDIRPGWIFGVFVINCSKFYCIFIILCSIFMRSRFSLHPFYPYCIF